MEARPRKMLVGNMSVYIVHCTRYFRNTQEELLAIRVMEARPRKVREATPSAHQAARKNYVSQKSL